MQLRRRRLLLRVIGRGVPGAAPPAGDPDFDGVFDIVDANQRSDSADVPLLFNNLYPFSFTATQRPC